MGEKKMRRYAVFALLVFLLAFSGCVQQRADEVRTGLSPYFDHAKEIGKVDLVITNIGYSGGSESLIRDFYKELVKIGVPDVMFMHTSYESRFFIAFFNKTSGKLCYVENGRGVVENVSYSYVLANADEWNEKIKAKVFSGYEFALLGYTQIYTLNSSYELLKSAEFHNHACPGLLSGYLIAEKIKEIAENYKKHDLLIFSVPPWCKDDALQIVFDATVGKKKMFVRNLSDEERENYPNIAGIYVFYDNAEKRGKGYVLTFDFDTVREKANVKEGDYGWLYRLKMNQWVLTHFEEARSLVGILGEFDVDENTLSKLQTMNFTIQELLGGRLSGR